MRQTLTHVCTHGMVIRVYVRTYVSIHHEACVCGHEVAPVCAVMPHTELHNVKPLHRSPIQLQMVANYDMYVCTV